MVKKPAVHSYSDQAAFDRLMVLIATLVCHPGVGSRSAKATTDQDSLESVRQHMQEIAAELNLPLPLYSLHTLRKDLVTLRRYGILDRNRHDWGYYLGTGAMNREELQFALNALLSQAKYQGDSQARRIYQTLSQRLKPMDLDSKGELFYPVRAHFNRVGDIFPAALRRSSRACNPNLGFGSKSASIPRPLAAGFLIGASPESIAQNFPLSLEQVYGVITFYLANRAIIDVYLEEGEAEFQQLQQSFREKSPLLYQKLKAAQAQTQDAV